MRKRVSHAKNSIKPTNWFPNICWECQPVSLIYLPVKKCWLSAPVPSCLVGGLQHLIRSIGGCKAVPLLYQHHGVNTSPTSSIQDIFCFLLSASLVRSFCNSEFCHPALQYTAPSSLLLF